ncbi:MAG: response regulator [Lachnospiraceae bacterium]|nr:response regulator [Lachnospiraceae bacterium]
MYQLVIGILYITIVGLFVVCWFAIRKWSSKLHAYLFFSGVSNLIYNAAIILELRARDQESFVVALKLGYLGRVWIGMSLFLFSMELCSVYIPEIVKAALATTHAVIYACILEIEHNSLYYNYMEFVMDGDFPKLIHTGGPLYYVQTALNLFYTVVGVSVVVRTYIREKNPVPRKRYMLMSIAMFSIGASYVIYFFKLVPIARKFDVMIFGFAIGNALMLIAIIKYRMLDAVTAARNYVIDELSEGIIVVDPEDRISYYNKPARNLFPVVAQKGAGSDQTSEVIATIRNAIDEGQPIRMDERIYTPKANPLIMEGEKVGTLYALGDDTEQYHYMTELRKQRQLAEEASKAKSQFLANMSHEIRTPINAILGMDEMVLRTSSEKEVIDYAEDIQTSGRTLLALINDILDFSKVEEGKMEIIPVQYEPGVMKSDLVNMVRERAIQKGLTINVDFDGNIPRLLKGDEIRIKQCALNLLTNAVKYTKEGRIGLKIGSRKEDDDHILLDFAVSDTGAGIRKEDMEELFSPFVRLDEEKNRSIEGSGLGISITKRLLDLMDSSLNVQSEYGKGSVFSFSVRQEVLDWEPTGNLDREHDIKERKKPEYKEMFHAPNASILVVDDIRMNLTVITKLLRKTMMKIDTAMSGPEAILLARKNDYDIIFVDHLMPDMDGIETLQHMKENEGDNHHVYIALTANAISGAREMYLAAGFADYVSKPVEGVKLEKLIMGYLPAEKLLDTPDSV